MHMRRITALALSTLAATGCLAAVQPMAAHAAGTAVLKATSGDVDPATGKTIVTLDASGSGASSSASYTFDFGDGNTLTTPNPTVTRPEWEGTYPVSVSIIDGGVTTTSATQWLTVGDGYHPVTPQRLLDTRSGLGAPTGKTYGVALALPASVLNNADGPVTAVALNVTVTDTTAGGNVKVYPHGLPAGSAPTTSNLNFTAGQTVANLVTVPVVNGKVDLRNSTGTVDLIADVTGYYSATGTSTFSPATPLRVLDTRDGTGARQGALGAGGIVSTQVAGVGGVPAGATAVLLNVTATDPTDTGWLTAYPHGTDRPGTSSLNWTAGRTVSHQILVPVVDGRVTFYNSTGSVNVTADLTGWFSA